MKLLDWAYPLLFGMLCAASALAEDGKFSRAEVAKRSKPAVAFVLAQANQRGATSQGTAFCVHPSGLFITNAHVVENAAKVELVVNPSLSDQKVLAATVLRKDEKVDLALLRAEGQQDLPALSLGDDKDLNELEEVIACGYPFGQGLTFDRKEFPSITITAGAIASLRKKAGELEYIQLDVSLNPGNSGGPVLDRSGKVIGVVRGGIRGTQINFAIPVRRVMALVAKPEFQFTPPALSLADRGKAFPIEARLITLLPAAKPAEVELLVHRDKQLARHRLAFDQGAFRANVVVLPDAQGSAQYGLEATFGEGSVAGAAGKISPRQDGWRLSDYRSVQ